jgi:hypothetical protein
VLCVTADTNIFISDLDHRILECAVAAQSEYLVTGDNHPVETWALNSAQHACWQRDQGDHQFQRPVHGDAR